jgi:hypothetical protein
MSILIIDLAVRNGIWPDNATGITGFDQCGKLSIPRSTQTTG